MAIWDGTPNYVMTTEQALAYARINLTSGQAVDQTLNSHHLLRFILGPKTVQGKKLFTGKNGEELAVGKLGFGNARACQGFRVEMDVMVAVSTGSALTVANSTSASSVKEIDPVRKFEFENFLYEDKLTQSKLLSLFNSQRTVSPSAIDTRIQAMHEGWALTLEGNMLSNTLAASAGPTNLNFASLNFILADGLTAGNRATYWSSLGYADSATGTDDETAIRQYMVDRAAVGNEWARALVRRPGTTVTTAQIRTYVRQLRDNGAENPVVWLNPTNFDQIANEVGNPANSGLRNEYMAEQIMKFGLKDYIIVNNNTIVTYDKSIPSNRGYILEPKTWEPIFSVLDTETFEAGHLRYAEQTSVITGQQLLCSSPRQNMKLLIQ